MREFLEIKLGGGKFTPMSPLFLYYEERKLEHSIHQDAGANPRDGFKVLAKMGCAPEPDAPYNIAAFTKPPQKKAVADATQFKIASYNRLNTLPDIQACLAGGTGVVLGFKVYDSFESDVVAQTGKVPMPQPNEALRGGHAVFAAGYNTDASWAGGDYLVVKNSWGTGWGDQGYFYMPFDYVNQNLVTDAWTALM